MSGEPAMRIRDASWAVDGIEMLQATSFDVPPGSATALVGPNGSGKTTLLRIACGRLEPTTGSVRVFGRAPDDRDAAFRADLAALLGEPGYYDDLTLADHLDFLGRLWDVDDAHVVLAELGIEHRGLRFLDEMSSGQRQLSFLALALARPARLLVLDEPEQRLDGGYRQALGDLLARRRDGGTAILFATHDPALRERVADQVIELDEAV